MESILYNVKNYFCCLIKIILLILFINNTNYILLAFFATLMTYLLTMLGALSVFLFKKINDNLMSFMFGFGAGVMIAASFFSLILPAYKQLENTMFGWLFIVLGFLSGGLFILLIDLFMTKLHSKNNEAKIKKIKNHKISNIGKGKIVIVSGGTSDIPVADEAYYTAKFLGNNVIIFD